MAAVVLVPAATSVSLVVISSVLSTEGRAASASSAAAAAAEVETVPVRAELLSVPVSAPVAGRPATSGVTAQQVATYLQGQAYLRAQAHLAAQNYLRVQNHLRIQDYLKVQAYLGAVAEQARLIARAPRMSTVTIGAPPPPTSDPTMAVSPPPPVSPAAPLAVHWAQQALGKPYKWAGAGPSNFDCSGLIKWAWEHAGVSLPHASAIQYLETARVPLQSLAPGDLVFYNNGEGPPQPGHVGLYVGNGRMIIADHTGTNVRYASINRLGFMGGGRVR